MAEYKTIRKISADHEVWDIWHLTTSYTGSLSPVSIIYDEGILVLCEGERPTLLKYDLSGNIVELFGNRALSFFTAIILVQNQYNWLIQKILLMINLKIYLYHLMVLESRM